MEGKQAKMRISKLLKSKKAQLTVFIIVGLFLVFSTGIFIYVKSQADNVKVPDVVIERVPSEFQAVQSYVTDCLKTSAEEALIKIGEGGGYIDFSSRAIMSSDPTDKNSNAAKSPGTTFQGAKPIPYWYYLQGDNTGTEFTSASQQPYLTAENRGSNPGTSIQEELESFSTTQFTRCIKGFSSFEGRGFFISQAADPNISVVIAEDDVVFKLFYPLTLKRGAQETKVSRYVVNIPLKLKKIFYLAEDIIVAQNAFNFLENDAIITTSNYAGLKDGDIPPTHATDFGGASKTWSKAAVEKQFKDIMTGNIYALQVEGSKNYRKIAFGDRDLSSRLKNGIYGNKVPLNPALMDSKDFVSDFNVGFEVPDTNQYFDIPNCPGAICKAATIGAPLLGVTMHNYNFVYDFSYPVVITIEDPEFESVINPDQKGFRFMFASEVNVRRSVPLTAKLELRNMEPYGSTMLCDEEQRNSGEISFNIRDSITNERIDNVFIELQTLDAKCFINVTNQKKEDFVTRLPSGFCGGKIILSKEGYLGKEINNVCINGNESIKYDITMTPFVQINAKLRYKKITKDLMTGIWKFQPLGEFPMNDKDTATITLTRIQNPGDAAYSIPLVFSADEINNDPVFENLSLAPGNYLVEGSVMTGTSFTIPKNARTYKEPYGSIGKTRDKTYYLPETDQVMDAYPAGGVSIIEEDSWVVLKDDLKKNDLIVFKIAYVDYLGTRSADLRIEDLDVSSDVPKYYEGYTGLLKPRFANSAAAVP